MWYLAWFRPGVPLDPCPPQECLRKETAANEKWIAALRVAKYAS